MFYGHGLLALSQYLNTGSHHVVQFGLTWHQLTYPSSSKKTGRRPLWSIMYLLQTTTRIRRTSSIMVAAKSFLDRSRPLSLQPTQMGSRFIRPLCVRPAANHESYGLCVHSLWLYVDCSPYIKPVMMQSTGWSLPWLQRSPNEMKYWLILWTILILQTKIYSLVEVWTLWVLSSYCYY